MQRSLPFESLMVMKKTLVILFLFTFFISCKKDPVVSLKNQVTGSWELATTISSGILTGSYPPGNGFILSFDKRLNFKRLSHDNLLYKGNYKLQEKPDCFQKTSVFLTTTDPLFPGDWFVEVRNDSLILSTPSCYTDGASSIYRKISD